MSVRRSATCRITKEITCRVTVALGRTLRVWQSADESPNAPGYITQANELISLVSRIAQEFNEASDYSYDAARDWDNLVSRVIDIPRVAAVQLANTECEHGAVWYVDWPN